MLRRVCVTKHGSFGLAKIAAETTVWADKCTSESDHFGCFNFVIKDTLNRIQGVPEWSSVGSSQAG